MGTPRFELTDDETAEIKRVLAREVLRLVLAPLLSQSGDYAECMDIAAKFAWDQVKAPVHAQRVSRETASQQFDRSEKWSFSFQGQPPSKPWEDEPRASRAYNTARIVLTHMAGYYPQTFSASELFRVMGDQLPWVEQERYPEMLRVYEHLGLLIMTADEHSPDEERFRARQPTLTLKPEDFGAGLDRSRNFLRLVGPVAESSFRKQGDVIDFMGRSSPEAIEAFRTQLLDAVRPIIQAFIEESLKMPESEHIEHFGVVLGVGQLFAPPRDVEAENAKLPPLKRGGNRRKRR